MMRKGLYRLTSKILATALIVGLYPGTLNVRAEDEGTKEKGEVEIATDIDSLVNTPIEADFSEKKESENKITEEKNSEEKNSEEKNSEEEKADEIISEE